ncbi:MAG: peptidase S41, partial [Clostridia bacterium]|nr:peptidase S41 [Clostridia bacterium]
MLAGDYASCNVATGEIGMYGDLDMIVLCNGNTASAAEVFTATLRDYEKAVIVGETTFGKGIMQSIVSLKNISYGLYEGYVKMTTHAYVTKCGVTYHDIGIAPDVAVTLTGEALEYSLYTLPQALDSQLQAALEQLN